MSTSWRSKSGQEALAEIREGSVGSPGDPGGIGRPTRR